VAADFPSLVSLACHDLRTPLATVQGFAKTMLRQDELDEEKRLRYLGLIDAASDELVVLLDLISLAARIENGRYDPVLHEADSLALAPDGASGAGTTVNVDPEAVTRALGSLERAAARHGGVDVSTSVDGPRVSLEPVVAGAAPVVLGDEQKDLGAAVAVRVLHALGAGIELEGERLTVTLPVRPSGI
jgi:signal transduction histidine kinase